jgi:aminoglycoside/choline kinase family phosphotransferase
MDDRAQERQAFAATHGWGDAAAEKLPVDASLRHYYRLRQNGKSALLMDCPPAHHEEDVRPFIRVDEHLRRLGMSAPALYAADIPRSLILLEDFGDDTFTRLLAKGHDERQLYELAIDALIHLHRHPDALDIELKTYTDEIVSQVAFVLDWYLPDIGITPDAACRESFAAAFATVFAALPPPSQTLMHRDYHVDNLLRLDRPGVKACGIIDFQDAYRCDRSYDVLSLLEDARRDMSPDLREHLLARYAAALPIDESFRAWYAALAGVRHLRIIGNLTRRAVRDGKPQYRAYLPRVFGYLHHSLQSPWLQPVAEWCKEYNVIPGLR